MNAITGVILAGGKSSRMGFDKGLALLNGKPMIEHMITVIEKLGLELIIISNNPAYKAFGYPVYADIMPEKGPVGGILTALEYSSTDLNLILSCDAPNVNIDVLSELLAQRGNSDITIAEHEGIEYPLVGIYSKRVKNGFRRNVEQNKLKLRSICSELEAKIVPFPSGRHGVDEDTFKNINTQEQLNSIAL